MLVLAWVSEAAAALEPTWVFESAVLFVLVLVWDLVLVLVWDLVLMLAWDLVLVLAWVSESAVVLVLCVGPGVG